MITISKTARKGLRKYLDEEEDSIGLRLVISGGIPGAYQPAFFHMAEGDLSPDDICLDCGDLKVYVDPETAPKAQGLKVDVLNTVYGPRLKFEFPSPEWDNPVANQVQKLIDGRINPGLISHGGYISLLSVNDGVAEIWMGGGCQGCGLSSQTMNEIIKVLIKEEVPEIHTVIDRTDHELGTSPYYSPTSREEPPTDPGMSKSARRRARRKRK
jgi:Fe/S biogenesis protein NfuA